MIDRLISIGYGAAALWFAAEAADQLVAGRVAVAVGAGVFAGCCVALALDYWPARIMTRRARRS